jgi:aldose 1-epimerase
VTESGAAADAGRHVVLLRAGDASLTIDPAAGGRFSSLVVGGHELLVTEGFGPIEWGCYPMAPFAGRIRDGRFTFRGRMHQLETNLPPNAIHGTVFARPWDMMTRAAEGAERVELATDLGPGWPFRGRVTETVSLRPDGLDASLVLEADEPMPAWLGWHPWLRREIGGATAQLGFSAERMYERDQAGLPTGELASPSQRPWDDAFVGVRSPIRLTWPGVLSLEIDATADVWVVYDERPYAICLEPQTAPPDAVNLANIDVPVAEPGHPVSMSMSWRWGRVARRGPHRLRLKAGSALPRGDGRPGRPLR